MTLFERIQEDRRQAIKQRQGKCRIDLLGVLIADASTKDKSPNDESVIKTIKSTVKKLNETKLKIHESKDKSNEMVAQYYDLDQEIMILNSYLPKQATELEIDSFINTLDITNMSQMMKQVKEHFHGQVNMGFAANLIKEALKL